MTGQKVVKVFCHEEKAIEQFGDLNEQLRTSAHEANRWANTLGPINNNLGHISYVICAMVGSALSIATGGTLIVHGTSGGVSDAEPQLLPADFADYPAAQLHHHGAGGR